MNGFWSKLIIVVACVQSEYYGLAAVAVAVSIVTLGYQLKAQRYAFFGARSLESTPPLGEPRLMATAMVFLAIGCMALSMLVISGLGDPILIGPAAQALLGGAFAL